MNLADKHTLADASNAWAISFGTPTAVLTFVSTVDILVNGLIFGCTTGKNQKDVVCISLIAIFGYMELQIGFKQPELAYDE